MAPGLILSDTVQANPDITGFQVTAIMQARSLKREAFPDDVEGTVVFLASDDSAFMSGQTLDRGRRLGVLDALGHDRRPRHRPDAGARRRPRRPPGGGARHRRRLPRDRLLRHQRPRRARPPRARTSARRAHAFFALPLADKLAARHPVAGTNRGYHPVGGETLSTANDAAAPPDLKEFFHVGPVDVSGDAYYTSA